MMQSRIIAVTGCEAQSSKVKVPLYLYITANIFITDGKVMDEVWSLAFTYVVGTATRSSMDHYTPPAMKNDLLPGTG